MIIGAMCIFTVRQESCENTIHSDRSEEGDIRTKR